MPPTILPCRFARGATAPPGLHASTWVPASQPPLSLLPYVALTNSFLGDTQFGVFRARSADSFTNAASCIIAGVVVV